MATAFDLPARAREVYAEMARMPEDQFSRLATFVASLPQERILTVTIDRLQRRLKPEDRPVFWAILWEITRLARTVESNKRTTADELIKLVVDQTELAPEA